jgi:hypothetical protein
MIAGSVIKKSGVPGWIILPLLLFALTLVIGYNGLYGQDAFEYLRYSRAIHAFFIDGRSPGQFFWPVMYPLSGALLSFVLPDILSLQLINIVCYGFTYYFLRKILRHLYPDKLDEITTYLLLFFSFSPFILRYTVSVMSEPMSLLFITAFLYYYLVFSENPGGKNFLLILLFGCAAVNTRYPSIVLLLVPFIHAAFLFIKNFRITTFMLSLLILLAGASPFFLLDIYHPASFLGRPDLSEWSFMNYFRRSFTTPDGNLSFVLPNIFYVFKVLVHPGYIFTGFLLLILLKRARFRRTFNTIVALSFLMYTLFLAGLQFQNDRVLLLSFPLVLILYSGPFLTLTEKMIQPHPPSPSPSGEGVKGVRWLVLSRMIPKLKKVTIIFMIIIQIILFYWAFRPFFRNNIITHDIAVYMTKYPGKKIYTFTIDMALKGYGITNETVNLWSKKIDYFEPNALVLINFADVKKQWNGMNPMLNWESLTKDHHLKLIERLPDGWNLYEITD